MMKNLKNVYILLVAASIVVVVSLAFAQETLDFRLVSDVMPAVPVVSGTKIITLEDLRSQLIKDLKEEIDYLDKQIPNVLTRLFSSVEERERNQESIRNREILNKMLLGEEKAAKRAEKLKESLLVVPLSPSGQELKLTSSEQKEFWQFVGALRDGLRDATQLFIKPFEKDAANKEGVFIDLGGGALIDAWDSVPRFLDPDYGPLSSVLEPVSAQDQDQEKPKPTPVNLTPEKIRKLKIADVLEQAINARLLILAIPAMKCLKELQALKDKSDKLDVMDPGFTSAFDQYLHKQVECNDSIKEGRILKRVGYWLVSEIRACNDPADISTDDFTDKVLSVFGWPDQVKAHPLFKKFGKIFDAFMGDLKKIVDDPSLSDSATRKEIGKALNKFTGAAGGLQ